ncbi:MAG: response regulator [Chloroflexi bacterium]|nr:response regulator [Chloroflexota bacterium]
MVADRSRQTDADTDGSGRDQTAIVRSTDPALAYHMAELRGETLRLLVVVSAAGLLTFQVGLPQVFDVHGDSPTMTLWHWVSGLVVLMGLFVCDRLRFRHPTLAAHLFVIVVGGALVAEMWMRGSAAPLALLPALVLAAVVLLSPLLGLSAGIAVIGSIVGLWSTGAMPWLSGDRLVEAGLMAAATLVAAWALARNLYQAITWSVASHAEAWLKTQEARQNRAELVGALKQLDQAYYRLQRANAALELAWKAAEEAERAKAEFATNISHELRTPLNLIVGFSELMLSAPESYGAPLPAGYRGDLYAVFRSAQHLLTLTNDVIDLARIGIGRLALAREPIDLAQVIGDACDIVRPYVEAKGLWLRLEIEPTLPVMSLDRLRIRQVLLNLMTNAARFTERGGITVAARHDDVAVRVTVTDTGAGIASTDLPLVFEEFYSTSETARPDGRGLGGVGLGLPLSREFVRLHGGGIGVDSIVGRGTNFWFTLPLGAPHLAAVQPSIGRPISAAVERILVLAGGDEQLADFLRRHLKGWSVLAAVDLTTAATIAIDARAQVVLADADLDSGGREASVPLIRLPLPHGERLSAALGAAGHLVKPIAREALVEAIANLGCPLRRVLLVDDDSDFVRLLERMLRASEALPDGCEVRGAHTGEEALAALAGVPPDLVLLDLVMPGLGGVDVLRQMRSIPALAGVPVIVLSGEDQLLAQFPLHGTLSVTAPEGFQLEELLGAVEALLGTLRPPRGYLTAPSTSA